MADLVVMCKLGPESESAYVKKLKTMIVSYTQNSLSDMYFERKAES